MNESNLLYYAAGLSTILLVIVIWQMMRLSKLDQVRKQFFSSGLKKDLEQILVDHNRSLSAINQNLKNLEKSL